MVFSNPVLAGSQARLGRHQPLGNQVSSCNGKSRSSAISIIFWRLSTVYSNHHWMELLQTACSTQMQQLSLSPDCNWRKACHPCKPDPLATAACDVPCQHAVHHHCVNTLWHHIESCAYPKAPVFLCCWPPALHVTLGAAAVYLALQLNSLIAVCTWMWQGRTHVQTDGLTDGFDGKDPPTPMGLMCDMCCAQAKAALPMLKARSAGGRQTRSRTAKTTPPKRVSASNKKAAEEKMMEAGMLAIISAQHASLVPISLDLAVNMHDTSCSCSCRLTGLHECAADC